MSGPHFLKGDHVNDNEIIHIIDSNYFHLKKNTIWKKNCRNQEKLKCLNPTMERRTFNVSVTLSISLFPFHITPNENNIIRQETLKQSNEKNETK